MEGDTALDRPVDNVVSMSVRLVLHHCTHNHQVFYVYGLGVAIRIEGGAGWHYRPSQCDQSVIRIKAYVLGVPEVICSCS